MPKWEYWIRTVDLRLTGRTVPPTKTWGFRFSDAEFLDTEGMSDYLDQVGDEGWELVSAMPITNKGYTVEWKLFFKRPKE